MSLDLLFLYPLLASFLMALSCSLVGALLFVSKRVLVGEALSHAAYPGAILAGALSAGAAVNSLLVILLAGLSAWFGKFMIEWLVARRRVTVDAALCYVLASFFGVGVLMASYLQSKNPFAYKQSLVFIFGQVATMTEKHVLIYALLGFLISLALILFYKELKVFLFDAGFAAGTVPSWLGKLLSLLTVLAVVVSMRSVGVVLLSAMLVAPATAARAWSRSFNSMLALSLVFGALSSIVGALLSIIYDLPTGPLMALAAAFFAFVSLIIAPRRGLLARLVQNARFTWKCRTENVIKAIYKREKLEQRTFSTVISLKILRLMGMVKGEKLTKKGEQTALQIIRLHRLFELYLTEQVGLDKDNVHAIAEDAEHYITPEIEKEIDEELNFPENDPHRQPIPRRPSS